MTESKKKSESCSCTGSLNALIDSLAEQSDRRSNESVYYFLVLMKNCQDFPGTMQVVMRANMDHDGLEPILKDLLTDLSDAAIEDEYQEAVRGNRIC